MAASHEMVESDVKAIQRLVSLHQGEVLETTNKRMIIRCKDQSFAKELAYSINDSGYALDMRKGLKTDKYYIQAWF